MQRVADKADKVLQSRRKIDYAHEEYDSTGAIEKVWLEASPLYGLRAIWETKGPKNHKRFTVVVDPRTGALSGVEELIVNNEIFPVAMHVLGADEDIAHHIWPVRDIEQRVGEVLQKSTDEEAKGVAEEFKNIVVSVLGLDTIIPLQTQ